MAEPDILHADPCMIVVEKRSLLEESRKEANDFRWFESQRHNRDMGPDAIRSWIRKHWNGFLRSRWLDHLDGVTYWIELRERDFGLLRREFSGDRPLLEKILQHLKQGWENLYVINWACNEQLCLAEVRAILQLIDINSRRMACDFDDEGITRPDY